MGCGSSVPQEDMHSARGQLKSQKSGVTPALVRGLSQRRRTERNVVRQSLSSINAGLSEEDVDARDIDFEPLKGLEWIGEAFMTPEKLDELKHNIILTRRLLIFLSSPFGGFEKERTIFMTEFFPKLKETCSQRGIAMEVVDLRWGITDDQSSEYDIINICLREVKAAHIFVGMLGARYGSSTLVEKNKVWMEPSLAKCQNHFPWVADYKDRSITELEWVAASMVDKEHVPCIFMFRDERYDSFVLSRIDKSKKSVGTIPEYNDKLDAIADKYIIENEASGEARLRLLESVRNLARDNTVKLFENYPYPHAGIHELSIALKILLKQLLPERFSNKEEKTHNAIKSYLSSAYVPLAGTLEAMQAYCDTSNTNDEDLQPMFVYGESGAGKSAMLAHVAAMYDRKADWCVLYHHTSSNNNVLSTLGRLGDKVITLLQNPLYFHKIGSWLKYKKAFDAEQNIAKQRKILTSAMRKVTTHFTKALHDFGGNENDDECQGEYIDSIYDSIAVMGSSRTLEQQTSYRLSTQRGETSTAVTESPHNTSSTNTTLSAKTLSDHEMYQRAMNAELRASYHVEDRKRQLLIVIDDFDALTFGDVDKDAIPFYLDFPAIVSLIARMILPKNVKIICSVSEEVLMAHLIDDPSKNVEKRLSNSAAAGLPNHTDASSNHSNGTNGGNIDPCEVVVGREIKYMRKTKKFIAQLKGNTFGASTLHKKYYRLVDGTCPVYKVPDLVWSEATAIAAMRAKLAGGKTLSGYFLEKLKGNRNWKKALFVKIIVEELINFGAYDIINNYIDIICAASSLTELMMIHIKYIYNYYEKILPGLFCLVLETLWNGPPMGVPARSLLEEMVDVLLTPSCKLSREDIESRVRVLVRTTTVIEYTGAGAYRIVDFTRAAVNVFLTTYHS